MGLDPDGIASFDTTKKEDKPKEEEGGEGGSA